MARAVGKIPGDESRHYVSPRKKRPRPKAKMQPPLTPMIDVTFQLLLFFLLTMTFRAEEGQIPSTLPKKGEEGAPTLNVPIRIIIRSVGEMRNAVRYDVNDVSIENDPAKLLSRLQALGQVRSKDKTQVVIEPLGLVRWGFVIEAYNQAVNARYKKVGFAPGG